ncbi:hypothetical protein U1Q18_006153 [Sarracenia purpurea var. burkii]
MLLILSHLNGISFVNEKKKKSLLPFRRSPSPPQLLFPPLLNPATAVCAHACARPLRHTGPPARAPCAAPALLAIAPPPPPSLCSAPNRATVAPHRPACSRPLRRRRRRSSVSVSVLLLRTTAPAQLRSIASPITQQPIAHRAIGKEHVFGASRVAATSSTGKFKVFIILCAPQISSAARFKVFIYKG